MSSFPVCSRCGFKQKLTCSVLTRKPAWFGDLLASAWIACGFFDWLLSCRQVISELLPVLHNWSPSRRLQHVVCSLRDAMVDAARLRQPSVNDEFFRA